jgi:hypothetical protein
MSALVAPHGSQVETYLVYTPSPALKRAKCRFQHGCFKLRFYRLHDAAELGGTSPAR